MSFGLTDLHISKIQEVFQQYPQIDRAVIYGSRAKGNYKPGSDIDLTLFGDELTDKILGDIFFQLDDLLLPYTIDLSIFGNIDNAKLREHIERAGLVFFEREAKSEANKLPAGWELKKLGDVFKLEYGKPLNSSLRKPAGKYPAYGANGIKCRTDEFLCEKDSIIVGRKGSAGELVLIKGKFWPLDVTYYVVLDELKYDLKFIFYLLCLQNLSKLATGVKPGINRNHVYSIKAYLPPLPEQQRIVTILDKAFAAIAQAKANAEQNLKNAKELFESYLAGVFENRSEGWEEKTLGDIGKVCMCKRILKIQTSENGEIPFYKIGTFGKTPNAFIPKEIYDEFRLKYSFPKKGDVLISASGTIGRRVIYDGKPAYFQDSNIVWIVNDETKVLNEYLYVFYGYCDWNPSKGATISRLYNDDLKKITISYPPHQEQKKIVRKLDTLSSQTKKLEFLYQQKIDALEELKKSLLQKAFRGELSTIKEIS